MGKGRVGYLIALLIFTLEQVTKWLVVGVLDLQTVRQIYVLPFFNLTWTENPGISLGLLPAQSDFGRWMLVAMTAAIASGVAYWISREKNRIDQAALGMILGGALGNIVDRIRFGYVVDFADFHIGAVRPFLVFNVADGAITIGVVILLLRAFLTRNEQPEESGDNA